MDQIEKLDVTESHAEQQRRVFQSLLGVQASLSMIEIENTALQESVTLLKQAFPKKEQPNVSP